MLQAMTAGNIDCYIAWEPYPAQAVSTGAGEIVARSNALWKEHPCCVLIASGNFARTRPEDTAKLIRAHRRACRFIGEHPTDALAIAVRYTGMSHDIIKEAMAHMRYSPEIDREKVGEFAAFLSDLHYLSPDRANKQLEFFNEN
jgi:NitT/TauT family transport system substrate-binding protein